MDHVVRRIESSRWQRAVLACVLVGCGGAEGDAPATVTAEIIVVPAGVQCVRVTRGTTVQSFAVTSNAAATLDLGTIPAGAYTFSAQAYNTACGSVNNGTVATWVGEAVAVTITPGVSTTIPFTLRPPARVTAAVDFVNPARSIALGPTSTYAVMRDGSVRAWGLNDRGQLGDGTTELRDAPVTVRGLTGVRQVSAGHDFACALREDGTAVCWGSNVQGQLGDGLSTLPSDTPVPVAGGLTFTQIDSGYRSTCGLRAGASGGVYCWGNVGIGDGAPAGVRVTPTLVSSSVYAVEVACADDFTCMRDRVGYARCWGANTWGTFGNGTSANYSLEPVYSHLNALQGLSVGSHQTCGLRADGAVYCAGATRWDPYAYSPSTIAASPERVAGLPEATQISVAMAGGCAVSRDRSVWCWGNNGWGERGDGTVEYSAAAVRVRDLGNVVQVACGRWHCCALEERGSVSCWGNNEYGQLGDGSRTSRFTPTRASL